MQKIEDDLVTYLQKLKERDLSIKKLESDLLAEKERSRQKIIELDNKITEQKLIIES